MVRRYLIALALGVALLLANTSLSSADGIVVEENRARNEFPNGVVFTVALRSDAEITDVTFRYVIPPEGAGVYEEPECTSGERMVCTFNLASSPKLFLVPGANIVYHWQAEDAAGNTLETEAATFVYEDDRFEWKSLTEGNLTLNYYAGSDSEVRALMQTGIEGLQRMESLVGTSVHFPVKVFLYDSARDMGPASYSSQGQEGVITLGEVFFSDTAVIAADVVPHDVLRHELAHIVIRQAVEGPFGDLPAWLDEGTATYAQSEPLSNEEQALERAIDRNDVLSLRSMSSSSLGRTSENVSLFYGQSWSLVSFLVDTYDPAKFAQLFAVFKEGSTVDKALQQVYGLDQDGLENAWRESVGLPPRQTAKPTEPGSTPLPQLTPFQVGDGSESTSDDAGFPVAIVAAGIAATLVVLAVVVLVLRRRRS